MQHQLSDNDTFSHFAFSVTANCVSKNWVLDSGATCCATADEADCIDVRECNMNVTAAGSSFTVKRIGTAVINTIDERGNKVQLRMQDTLISDRFTHKLLALQRFTSKGFQVIMGAHNMRIASSSCQAVFLGCRDPATQLFVLQPSTPGDKKATPTNQCFCLINSTSSDLNWCSPRCRTTKI